MEVQLYSFTETLMVGVLFYLGLVLVVTGIFIYRTPSAYLWKNEWQWERVLNTIKVTTIYLPLILGGLVILAFERKLKQNDP